MCITQPLILHWHLLTPSKKRCHIRLWKQTAKSKANRRDCSTLKFKVSSKQRTFFMEIETWQNKVTELINLSFSSLSSGTNHQKEKAQDHSGLHGQRKDLYFQWADWRLTLFKDIMAQLINYRYVPASWVMNFCLKYSDVRITLNQSTWIAQFLGKIFQHHVTIAFTIAFNYLWYCSPREN